MERALFSMMLDAGLHRELKIMAVQNGVSMKHLIEQGIGIVLNAEKKRNEFAGKRDA